LLNRQLYEYIRFIKEKLKRKRGGIKINKIIKKREGILQGHKRQLFSCRGNTTKKGFKRKELCT